jgi:hypothetical protein
LIFDLKTDGPASPGRCCCLSNLKSKIENGRPEDSHLAEALLNEICSPADLRRFGPTGLEQVAREIRALITQTVAARGGHLASNLGVVDLTVALHRASMRRSAAGGAPCPTAAIFSPSTSSQPPSMRCVGVRRMPLWMSVFMPLLWFDGGLLSSKWNGPRAWGIATDCARR